MTEPDALYSADWFLAAQTATDLNDRLVTPWEPRGWDANLDVARSSDELWVWHDGSVVLTWDERGHGWEAV